MFYLVTRSISALLRLSEVVLVALSLQPLVFSQTWNQVEKLTTNDATFDQLFGVAVALKDGTALIGANGDQQGGTGSGAAYIFQDDGLGQWQETIKLTASDANQDDQFGAAVDLDGNTAIIGAFGMNASAGAAYLFEKDGTWGESQIITPNDAEENDQFGFSVSISENTALVGAPFGNKSSIADVGAAYVFQKNNLGVWQETAKLTADDANAMESDQFGYSVALKENLALIGAWTDGDNGSNSGAAYLFESDGQGSWNQIAKLTASDAMPGDNFGFSVALYGNTALVGAPFGDAASFPDIGAAYLFHDDGLGTWQEISKLTAADAALFDMDQFGFSVALGKGVALIGATFDSDADFASGAAYVFADDGSGNWGEVDKLIADDAAGFDQFGSAVALAESHALIGAIGSNGAGGAYVFSNESPFLAADFNEDNSVDSADLNFWQAGYGISSNASHLNGDADADGDVDGNDFLYWQRQFGSPNALASTVFVPEPDYAIYGMFALGCFLFSLRNSPILLKN